MDYQLTVKYSDNVEAALNQLQERWTCTRTEAVRRAILAAVEQQQEPVLQQIDISDIEYGILQIRKNLETISSTQAELIESQQMHHKHNLHSHLMLLRQAGQTTYSSHFLAAQSNLYDRAKEKFTAWWPTASEEMKNAQ